MSAFDTQIDGTHYKDKAIQPVQLAYAVFGGDTLACKVSKYLTREKDGWESQIGKAQHCLEMFAEMVPSSPIPPLDLARQLVLEQFVVQEPEPVRAALKDILAYMICLAQGHTDEPPEALTWAFNTIREHYLGEPDEVHQ